MSPKPSNIPKSVRLSEEVSKRVSAFLKEHPSYSYADLENLALSNLLTELDGGARIVDEGKGLQVVKAYEPGVSTDRRAIAGKAGNSLGIVRDALAEEETSRTQKAAAKRARA